MLYFLTKISFKFFLKEFWDNSETPGLISNYPDNSES